LGLVMESKMAFATAASMSAVSVPLLGMGVTRPGWGALEAEAAMGPDTLGGLLMVGCCPGPNPEVGDPAGTRLTGIRWGELPSSCAA
jgi:hypothetical protein